MGFLRPKVSVPPPPPPPPPPVAVPEPVTPDPVVRPNTVVDATKEEMTGDKAKKKANLKTNVKTSARGVIGDAPLAYNSLIGSVAKNANLGSILGDKKGKI